MHVGLNRDVLIPYLSPFIFSFFQFFEWLLLQVNSSSVVHDILWQFVRSVSDHPMVQAAAAAKAEREEEAEKEEKDSVRESFAKVIFYMYLWLIFD